MPRASDPRAQPIHVSVLNVTPDSFSDGGQFAAPERALAQAEHLEQEVVGVEAVAQRPAIAVSRRSFRGRSR